MKKSLSILLIISIFLIPFNSLAQISTPTPAPACLLNAISIIPFGNDYNINLELPGGAYYSETINQIQIVLSPALTTTNNYDLIRNVGVPVIDTITIPTTQTSTHVLSNLNGFVHNPGSTTPYVFSGLAADTTLISFTIILFKALN